MPAVSKPTSPAEESRLSFVPAGIARSVAEYTVAAAAGAIPLFGFFLLAEVIRIVIADIDMVAVVFLPVICFMPIIAGAISTLVLEKLRTKPLTFQRGAMVGAAGALAGSLASVALIFTLSILGIAHPFGAGITGILLLAALLAAAAMDTVLGALGGALVVKFLK